MTLTLLFASTEEVTTTFAIPIIDAWLYNGLAAWNAKTIAAKRKCSSCSAVERPQTSRSFSRLLLLGGITVPQVPLSSPPPPQNL
ncbi:hypothetical protein M514_20949 [Trichuris suis]|uniref:Uncharacterized protein n=1 Tax=Trichuris suis TaxID=68888 RepID=A0A085NBF9_9BILA|nr:hypothetical protein M514_20949 [Trichuris suis]